MNQQPVTDAELVDALSRKMCDLPPPPSQSFTVHEDNYYIPNNHPSFLYDKYGGGADSSGCVYFFDRQFNYDDWSVAAGTQPILESGGGGTVVGRKNTLVFHEGRWLPKACWAVDEFTVVRLQERFKRSKYPDYGLRLYRLRRLDP